MAVQKLTSLNLSYMNNKKKYILKTKLVKNELDISIKTFN